MRRNMLIGTLLIVVIAVPLGCKSRGNNPNWWLRQSRAIAKQIQDSDERGGSLAFTVNIQCDARMCSDALETAREIDNRECRAWTLCNIAAYQAYFGNLHDAAEILPETFAAVQAADSPENRHFHSRAALLGWVADLQARVGNAKEAADTLKQALAAADEIRDSMNKASCLARIGCYQQRPGGRQDADEVFRKALDIARGIPDTKQKIKCLTDVAFWQVGGSPQDAASTCSEALAIAKATEDKATVAYALGQIAQTWTNAGRLKEAMETAGELEKMGDADAALRNIAYRQILDGKYEGGIGEFEEAIITLKRIKPTGDDKMFGGDLLAEALARSGKIAEAESVAGKIMDARAKVNALSAVGEMMAKSGDKDGAKTIFSEALTTAHSIEDIHNRDWGLMGVAEAQANGGLFAEAIATANQIHELDERGIGFSSVAKALGEAEQSALLLKTFESMKGESASVRAAYCRSAAEGLLAKKIAAHRKSRQLSK